MSTTTIYRSGTPTVALAASLETALNSAVNELPGRAARVKEANLYLRTALSKYPKVRINSPESAIPHILNPVSYTHLPTADSPAAASTMSLDRRSTGS